VGRHLLNLLLLAALGLGLFHPLVLHPTQVLYTDQSDLLSLHVPRKQLLVRSWAETGELPLWNPYEFCGAPFIHDIQVAAFYPPHAVLYLVGAEHVGAALSWLLVAHVILAGWCMYAYAASEGLSPTAALVSAIGYMLAGKWLLHMVWVGHYILAGLAWLPLLLLGMSRAIRRRSLASATLAGVVLALIILGTQPQWTFYAGLFAAAWTLIPALEAAGYFARKRSEDEGGEAGPDRGGEKGADPACAEHPPGRSGKIVLTPFLRWLGVGLWVVLVGVGLSAIQLLPTAESTRYSTRGIQGIAQQATLLGMLATTVTLVGPGVFDPRASVIFHEFRGNAGLLWVLAAAAAPWLGGRKERWQLAIALVFVVLAVGGLDLIQWVTGLNLFRLPARMIIIVGLPLALLAGRTTQALLEGRGRDAATRRQCSKVLTGVVLFTLVTVLIDYGIMAHYSPEWKLHPYWLTCLATLPLAAWLVAQRASTTAWRVGWTAVLAADALGLSWLYVEVRPYDEIFAPARCVEYLAERTGDHARVLDLESQQSDHRTSPLGNIQPLLRRIHTLRGYNPLNVHHFWQYLNFVSDVDSPPAFETGIASLSIVNKSLLDLAGVRYLLQPSAAEYAPPQSPPVDVDPRWKAVFADARPRVYVFSGLGVTYALPQTVYENVDRPLPRAFVVPAAQPLPEPLMVLAALRNNDFTRRVYLGVPHAPAPGADLDGGGVPRSADSAAPPPSGEPAADAPVGYRPAKIRSHRPNEVVIDVAGDTPGWLVLTDVWFPGWECTVDGRAVEVQCANYTFRAVAVPAGDHQVVFRYRPPTYLRGQQISAATGLGVLVILIGSAIVPLFRRRA